MPFTIDPGPEVDAEYVVPPAQQLPVTPYQPQPVQPLVVDYRERDVVDLRTDVSANPSMAIELYEKRTRAVVLFLELPLLTMVALSDKSPGLIRLGAGLLAIWKATQMARGGAEEIQSTAEQWMEQ